MLLLSDQYLVPSLKRFCSNFIEENVQYFNIIELITIARSMMILKLEKVCTEFIANNLDEFLEDEQFKQLVLDDAQRIQSRQETDTIDIVDDVRYYLSVSKHFTVDSLRFKYQQIDIFLNSLGFDI